MVTYNEFIGIDIGKKSFFVHVHGKSTVKEYENTPQAIEGFIKQNKAVLSNGFVVLEATGGYELALLLSLTDHDFHVHRANTRQVKHFIRSYGNNAKTDQLDAKHLSRYGYERHTGLALFQASTPNALALYELVQRRADLKHMLVAEKNRRQSPKVKHALSSINRLLDVLTQELEDINDAIESLIQEDDSLRHKHQVLMSVPGIGKIVSSELLAMLPELGTINRRQAASLAGVAPRANDSGQFTGYRSVSPGRNQVKPILFLAAMAARNSKSSLKIYYEGLIARGKKKMVALVALMRKIIVIANARLKEEMNLNNI